MKDKRKRARDEADQEEDKGDEEQQQEQQQEEEEEEEEDVIEEEEDSEDGEDKEEDSDDDDDEEDDEEDEEDEPFRGIAESAAIAPSPSSAAQNLPSTSSAPFVFVLQRASLQVAKLGKNRNSSSGGSGLTVLNCDDHRRYLMRHKKDPAQYRPDIIHQALLALLDSPLNKAGKIKSVYVHTDSNVLFRISPHTRLPRTFRRFTGLMAQLLQKLSVRAASGSNSAGNGSGSGGSSGKLMQVVKQPVTRHLPVGARRIGLSATADLLTQEQLAKHINDLTLAPSDSQVLDPSAAGRSPIVFVIGSMAHGRIDESYVDETIGVSGYPLSAAAAIARLCNVLEVINGIA